VRRFATGVADAPSLNEEGAGEVAPSCRGKGTAGVAAAATSGNDVREIPRATVSSVRRIQTVTTLVALVLAVLMGAEDADARGSDGLNAGKKEFRTFIVSAAATTSAGTALAVDRPAIARSSTYPGGSLSQLFKRPGLLGGFAAGFLGAGLLGLLFGQGLFGGLGSAASFLGLMLQLALLVMLARLIWTWWRGDNVSAFAELSPRQLADAYGRPRHEVLPIIEATASSALDITAGDYKCFQRLLGEIETAYGREDIDALRACVTPQMLGHFSKNLARNAGRGVVNVISDIKLIEEELANAWREGDIDYAAVDLRFSRLDRTVERASGRVVEGSDSHPTEATQVWTFSRAHGQQWLLSAIQQR
jgi:predicted lipid-binding transport protein (Tim44 family)